MEASRHRRVEGRARSARDPEPFEEYGTGQWLPFLGHLRILVDPLGCHQHKESVSGRYDT
jgi:hypothetical protein